MDFFPLFINSFTINGAFPINCANCGLANPAPAAFCMHCGSRMPEPEFAETPDLPGRGYKMLGLTLAASLLISLLLARVFGLPIFILAGFLPLFWPRSRK